MPGRAEGIEVARQFQRGDPGAVARVRQYVRRILSWRGYRLPAEDRRDLEQETLTQLWQVVNRAGFAVDQGFWSFVQTVTTRRTIDWLRSRRASAGLHENLFDKGADPQARALARERSFRAMEVLERLEPPCRKLIFLHAVVGMSYAKMSPILGKTSGALRVQMYRCIEKARGILLQMERNRPRSSEEGASG